MTLRLMGYVIDHLKEKLYMILDNSTRLVMHDLRKVITFIAKINIIIIVIITIIIMSMPYI